MRRRIQECLGCHCACLTTAWQYCLETGGKHVETGHRRVMLACVGSRRTSAYFTELGTGMHKRVCARVCEARGQLRRGR